MAAAVLGALGLVLGAQLYVILSGLGRPDPHDPHPAGAEGGSGARSGSS